MRNNSDIKLRNKFSKRKAASHSYIYVKGCSINYHFIRFFEIDVRLIEESPNERIMIIPEYPTTTIHFL